jgi:transcription elongation factor Elf1
MATKRQCRSCELTNQITSDPVKHKLITADYYCPLCNKIPKWYSHLHKELLGDSLECKSCRNYILYVVPDIKTGGVKKWKDEINSSFSLKNEEVFIMRDIFVMRDYEDNRTYVFVGNSKNPIKVNSILEFKSLEDLTNKVKTIVVFS